MIATLAETLPSSLAEVLRKRGYTSPADLEAFLSPSLSSLGSPALFSDMEVAVKRLLKAIQDEEIIAIYADRDVDGLTGLAILARSIRTLGAQVQWGNPKKGRGLDHAELERLAATGARTLIFVDCGIGDDAELAWLASQEIEIIIADHHRLPQNPDRSAVLAYIHPGVMSEASTEAPAGCVMAFKLAQALWESFLGTKDADRMDYFLFDHLDLLCLGILADRVPVTGENRTLIWHGLRRLAKTRKAGLQSLMRFFRLLPRTTPLSVREASWQIIPLLNAAGRMGRPECAAELLLTEDAAAARAGVDQLLEFNTQRRSHQDKSLDLFERLVLEQCAIETDGVLIALAKELEPSVTGLAAQAIARKYGRPTFLFVDQGETCVGSGRGIEEGDLFALIESHQDLLIRYGGHHGAVGLTIRTQDLVLLRERLLKATPIAAPTEDRLGRGEIARQPEAALAIGEADSSWWAALQSLEPFGPGFPCPVFDLTGVTRVEPVTRARLKPVEKTASKRTAPSVRLVGRAQTLKAEWSDVNVQPLEGPLEGAWRVRGYPVVSRKEDSGFKWIILELIRDHGQNH